MIVTQESADRQSCRLVFGASMTKAHVRELEDEIIKAMRRYKQLEVDLSGVNEIDLCGVHLLGLLQSLGGNDTRIVGTSPLVQHQCARLLSSYRSVSLRGSASERPG